MQKNKPSGEREIRDFLEWLNMQQTRVLVKPTAPVRTTEDPKEETVSETKELL